MFEKILIANRGEIACRIAAECRRLGLFTVGVYSDADQSARHVALMDQTFHIGESRIQDSYLRIDRIVETALSAGVEAVHPGYGLLSENPDFVDACESAGLVFVGPRADVIRRMADKAEARRVAASVDAPVIPGTVGVVTADEAPAHAERIGYPLLVKSTFGRGGIGLALASGPDKLEKVLKRCQHAAQSSFGDGSVYLERLIENPRHIEVQVLFDNHGSGIHLGERECSIQRLNQKIIEEAPSPFVARDPDLRRRVTESALRIARAVDYNNAGTIEFLVDSDGAHYFIEMNTRLQVEHPVTELVTGVDLIEAQLRIASGESLWMRQGEVEISGHAIECRIYAEDPDRKYLPQPGRIDTLMWDSAEGLRIDSGVAEGDQLSPYYDPLLAKVITVAPDREGALARMSSALRNTILNGIKTNMSFLGELLEHPDVQSGRLDTGLVRRYQKERAS